MSSYIDIMKLIVLVF